MMIMFILPEHIKLLCQALLAKIFLSKVIWNCHHWYHHHWYKTNDYWLSLLYTDTILTVSKPNDPWITQLKTDNITTVSNTNPITIACLYHNMISGRNLNLALALNYFKRVKYFITYCNITNTRGVYGILLNSEEIKENIYVLNTTEYQL